MFRQETKHTVSKNEKQYYNGKKIDVFFPMSQIFPESLSSELTSHLKNRNKSKPKVL